MADTSDSIAGSMNPILPCTPTRGMYSKPLPKELRLMIWAHITINESQQRLRDPTCWNGTRIETDRDRTGYLNLQPIDVAAIERAGGNLGYQRIVFDSFEASILPLLLPPRVTSNTSLHHQAREEYEDSWKNICFVFVLERWGNNETDAAEVGPTFLWPLDNISRYLAYNPPPWLEIHNRSTYLETRVAFLSKISNIEVQYAPALLKLAAEFHCRSGLSFPGIDGETQLLNTNDNFSQITRELVEFFLALTTRFRRLHVTFVITDLPFHTEENLYASPGWQLRSIEPINHTHIWGPMLQCLERQVRCFLSNKRFRVVYRRKDASTESGYREIELLPGPKDLQQSMVRSEFPVIIVEDAGNGQYVHHAIRSVWMKRTIVKILELHGLSFEDDCEICFDADDCHSCESFTVLPPQIGTGQMGRTFPCNPIVTPFGSMENLALSDSGMSSIELTDVSEDESTDEINDDESTTTQYLRVAANKG